VVEVCLHLLRVIDDVVVVAAGVPVFPMLNEVRIVVVIIVNRERVFVGDGLGTNSISIEKYILDLLRK